MKAIIMAGGEGTRLRPLTCTRPKPMVPLVNRPVMAHAVDLLRRFGWDEIGVTLQYLPRQVMDFFGSGEETGVRLQYFLETSPLGTAGSVKNASSFLDETFVVISGDALTDFPLDQAVEFHRRQGAMATIVLTGVENPLEYGVVITDSDGRIQRFLEKPGWGEVFSDRINTGIYVLEPEVLDLIPDGRSFDFSKDLFPLMLRQQMPLFGHLLQGFWCDIGNISEYRRAHQEVLAGHVKVEMPGRDRGEGIRVGQGTNIDPRASLRGPVLIGSNCRLEAGVTIEPYTVIGDNVIVEEGASLKQAVVWDGSTIGRRSAVRRAVIGQGATLEDNTAIYEGAAVGDSCVVRSFSVIKPEVKIWPSKEIDKYSTVKDNVVWSGGCSRSLFNSRGIGGYLHRELTPPVVANIAGAFAGNLPPGSAVTMSRAPGAGPGLLGNAVLSGLVGGGLRVIDLGEALLPFNRFTVRSLGLSGGVHIRRDPGESGRLWLVFLDERGLPLANGQRRKIDSAFQQGDFRRSKEEDLFPVETLDSLEERYLSYLAQKFERQERPQRTRFMIYTPSAGVLASLRRIEPFLPWSFHFLESTQDLRQSIRSQGATGGAIIDSEGERLLLWDAEGNPLPMHAQNLILAQVALASDPKPPALALPVTVSSRAAALAQVAGVDIVWVKDDWRAIAEAAWQDPHGGRQVEMLGDALYTLISLAQYLSGQNLTLQQAQAALPRSWQKAKDIRCPWSAKGKVLRQLTEQESTRGVEMVDGLKVYHKEGWALVLPDADEPFYHVYAEAFSPSSAESLCQQYVNKIDSLLQD